MHSVLRRQLKKAFGSEKLPMMLPGVSDFVRTVDKTYAHNDDDRKLTERSLDLSSRELSEANDILQATLEATADAILAVTVEGVVSAYNTSFIEMWDLDHDFMKTCDQESLLHEMRLRVANPEAFVKRVRELYVTTGEAKDELVTTDGRIIERFVRPQLIEGRLAGRVVSFRDVTRDRKISQAKSEFVSVASHQLRTPLTSVVWYTEAALDGEFGRISAKLRGSLQAVHESGKRMSGLIDTLLNVTRIEMGYVRVASKPIYVQRLIEEIIGETKPLVKAKNLDLAFVHGKSIDQVRLDWSLTKMVLQNVIVNAIKYTPEGGNIGINLSRDSKSILVHVSDTGIGIPRTQHGDVFKKLFRASNASKVVQDGSGLGLYIAKRVVTDFGGDITFESEEGRGSVFTIKLPLSGMEDKEGRHALIHTSQ